MRRHAVDSNSSTPQYSQYAYEYKNTQLSSACYMSPPNSSPRDDSKTTPKSVGKKRMDIPGPTDRPHDELDLSPPLEEIPQPQSKQAGKRRAVFNVDASFSALFDDRLDEEYIPTQYQGAQLELTPPTTRKKAKKQKQGKKRTVSPEIGESNRTILDYFFPIDKTKPSEFKTPVKEDRENGSPEIDEISPSLFIPNNGLKTPSKRGIISPFKTPQNRKIMEIPSSTPGLSPLSKSLGWVSEELSPTPKANMRNARKRMASVIIPRKAFVVPASQWDDCEHDLFLESQHSSGEEDISEAFQLSGGMKLTRNSLRALCENEKLNTSQSFRGNLGLIEPLNSIASGLSYEVAAIPCGQKDPYRTQLSRTSLRRDDEDPEDWDRQRKQMNFLMGSFCDEVDDRAETGLQLEGQSLEDPWNYSLKSPLLGKTNIKNGRRLFSRTPSQADSCYSELYSESQMKVPATQQRPLSRSVSITESVNEPTKLTLSAATTVNNILDLDCESATDECDSDFQDSQPVISSLNTITSESPEPAFESQHHDQHVENLHQDHQPCSQYIASQQPTCTQFAPPTKRPIICSSADNNHLTQTQASISIPSTQFYMDKILTESMLESLPLPDFATQAFGKPGRKPSSSSSSSTSLSMAGAAATKLGATAAFSLVRRGRASNLLQRSKSLLSDSDVTEYTLTQAQTQTQAQAQ